jgi:hypothetical protein
VHKLSGEILDERCDSSTTLLEARQRLASRIPSAGARGEFLRFVSPQGQMLVPTTTLSELVNDDTDSVDLTLVVDPWINQYFKADERNWPTVPQQLDLGHPHLRFDRFEQRDNGLFFHYYYNGAHYPRFLDAWMDLLHVLEGHIRR